MRLVWATLGLFVVAGVPMAWGEEFREYWEFRYLSALPGGGFGVTPQGRVGFDGAIQLNVPVAYTPCQGNYVAGYWSASTEPREIHVGSEGAEINGTGLVAAGFGKPERGIFVANMVTSRRGESAYNAQVQLTSDNFDKPAFAIGVVDWSGRRDRYTNLIGRGGDCRSFYGVATGRLGSDRNFVYLTLGFGNGRFNNSLFGGVSWPASDRLTVFGEYDGFNVNAGVAYSHRSRFDRGRWNVVLTGAVVDMNRPEVGACLTYAPEY